MFFLVGCASEKIGSSAFRVSRYEAREIGQKIFRNECAGKEENLIAWNVGEEFPSLGIGHFIWFPKDCNAPFKESFPSMMEFMSENGAPPPSWVSRTKDAPWRNKAEFDRHRNSWSTRMLRSYLYRTQDLQTEYMMKRFYDDIPKMINSAAPRDREKIKANLYSVARSRHGMYLLIDYVNFKGAGISVENCYNKEGWGLRQVLEEMRPAIPGVRAKNNFADAAYYVLERRVKNSPPERGEKRWLPGWKNRIDTYRM